MKSILLKLYCILFCLLFSAEGIAQVGDNNSNGTLEGNDVPAAPINEKLTVLAFIGIFFAFYTFKKHRREQIL